MRKSMTCILAALGLMATQAMAYENFIPLGHNYSPDDPTLPEFSSKQDKFETQVDIYETDIYVRQRAAREFWSDMKSFTNDQDLHGSSDFVDY